MYPVSQEFLDAIAQNHVAGVYVQVVNDGIPQFTLGSGSGPTAAPGPLPVGPIITGKVTLDITRAVWRDVTLQIQDYNGDLVPRFATDPLGPGSGNEVRPYRGIALPQSDGTTVMEWVPLGVFNISLDEIVDDGKDFTFTMTGYDRSRRISRNSFRQYFQIPAGTTPAAAIQMIAASQAPWLQAFEYNISVDGQLGAAALPLLTYNIGDDPWQAMSAIAIGAGGEVFFDVTGTLNLRVIPDPATSPIVFTYTEGEGGALIGVDRRIDDQYVINDWIVLGQNSSATAPLYAEAFDQTPGSPTNVDTYGYVVGTSTDPTVTTTAQAIASAQALLLTTTGITDSINWTSAINPAHDGEDIIAIVRAKSKVNAIYGIQSFNMPLDVITNMTGTTKLRNTT